MRNQSKRFILSVALIPFYFFGGGLLSLFASDLTGLWEEYIAAVLLPLIGIILTWYILPRHKLIGTICVYLIGVGLAYEFSYPSYYPENYGELGYAMTYKPFIISVSWGLFLVVVLAFSSFLKHKPKPVSADNG